VSDSPAGFLARWSQRKVQARHGEVLTAPEAIDMPTPVAVTRSAPASVPVEDPPAAAEPAPTMDDVAVLTPASDFTRFVARGVDPGVKNAALKKLFTDPHFNLMDGLDTYIEDFGQADPLPASMLQQMAQARFLGLLTEQPEAATAASSTLPASSAAAPDEDPDLRLQPDDAAGRPGAEPGPGGDTGRQP
jgi:hypothetical protein